MRNQSHKNFNLISLFSGCGGMDLGFEGGFEVLKKSINKNIHPEWNINSGKKGWVILPHTCFKTVFANDILSAAKAAWIPYFNDNGNEKKRFHLGSVVDLVKSSNSNGNNIFPKADVVIGGFPCQDFSVAGKRKGFKSLKGHHGRLLNNVDNPTEENRGKLYVWMKRVIEIVLPKVFVAENVKGLVSLEDTKQIIENDFRKIGSGYLVVDAQVLYAPMFGVPQSRERIFFIGFRKDALKQKALSELSKAKIIQEFYPYPKATHGINEPSIFPTEKLNPYVTAGDYILDLPEPEKSNDLSQQSYSKAKWYGTHCQGQTEIDIGGIAPTIRAEHHGNIKDIWKN